jgi:hypothetical protein
MNRHICTDKYGTCEPYERCDCHKEEIEAEIEFEEALKGLKVAIEKLGESNKAKLEAIAKVKPFLTDLENLTK